MDPMGRGGSGEELTVEAGRGNRTSPPALDGSCSLAAEDLASRRGTGVEGGTRDREPGGCGAGGRPQGNRETWVIREAFLR
jgi:hypothetical protein